MVSLAEKPKRLLHRTSTQQGGGFTSPGVLSTHIHMLLCSFDGIPQVKTARSRGATRNNNIRVTQTWEPRWFASRKPSTQRFHQLKTNNCNSKHSRKVAPPPPPTPTPLKNKKKWVRIMNLHRAFLLYHAPHLPQNRSTPIGSHQRSREKKLSIKRHSKPMKIQTPRIQRRAETKAHGRLVLASLCQITPDKPPIEAAWSGHRTFTCPLSRQQNWCWIDSATAYHTRVIDNPPPGTNYEF